MIPEDSAQILRQQLVAGDVDLTQPSIRLVWKAFLDFAAVPAEDVLGPEDDGDGLLVQYGVVDFGDEAGRHFALDFTRQFIDTEGAISQLSCALEYDAAPALEAIASDNLWSFGLTLHEFADRAERLEGFRLLLTSEPTPQRLRISYDDEVC
ncbi:hypothetical protein [Kribbella lupini]|uniref:Uncharacterized protein n=1 Tax=Kribbella lupini TaxID=291602 RepID=A0ABN2AYT7_9ACTN